MRFFISFNYLKYSYLLKVFHTYEILYSYVSRGVYKSNNLPGFIILFGSNTCFRAFI